MDIKIKILTNKRINLLAVKMKIRTRAYHFPLLNLAVNKTHIHTQHIVMAKNAGEHSGTLLMGLQIPTNSS